MGEIMFQIIITILLLLPWPFGPVTNGALVPWPGDPMPNEAFNIDGLGTIDGPVWPTSGTATAGSTGFSSVATGYTHGTDSIRGNYIIGDGTLGNIFFDDLATQGTFWNAAGAGDSFDVEFWFALTSLADDWDSQGADNIGNRWQFSGGCYIMDIASTFELRVRALTADGMHETTGPPPSMVRLDINESGMTTRPRNSIWVPLDKPLKLRVRAEKGVSTSTVSVWINDELLATDAGHSNTSTNLRGVVIWRGCDSNGKMDAKLYGPFVGTENADDQTPGSTYDGTHFAARGVSITDDSGHWTNSGTTLGGDWGEGTLPAWGLPYATLGTGDTLTLNQDIGTPLSSGGKGVLRFLIRPTGGNTRITINEAGNASVWGAFQFAAATGLVAHSGDGVVWSTLEDSGGADQTFTVGDAYELVIYHGTGAPTYSLHNLSADWETEQSFWAGALPSFPTGTPNLGQVIISDSTDADFAGLFMQTREWVALCSSYTSAKNTTADLAGRANLLDAAWRAGQHLADGGEITGVGADDRFWCPSDAHKGRSGHNLTKWTDYNPAFSELLPYMPASRWVFFDTSVNDLASRTGQSEAQINAAGDSIMAVTQAFITAAAANGVEAEFGSQVPGDADSASWIALTEAEQQRVDAGIQTQLLAAGRPDLFTYSDVLASLIASEGTLQLAQDAVFNIGTDSIHYAPEGDDLVYALWYSTQASIGVAGSGTDTRTNNFYYFD